MQLTSPAFEPDGQIPMRYTCDGENENPPLTLIDVPDETRSLAIIMHDPDAVSGDFLHWMLWDIDPGTREIKANDIPMGAIEGANSSGDSGYTGPCPPPGSGIHHYHFTAYALDIPLDLPASASHGELMTAMQGHEIANAVLIGLFERSDDGLEEG